jgi:hypothetical protein
MFMHRLMGFGTVQHVNDSLNDGNAPTGTRARDELRLLVLLALQANSEFTQWQLAAALGVSIGGVNHALKAPVDRGFVKAANIRR